MSVQKHGPHYRIVVSINGKIERFGSHQKTAAGAREVEARYRLNRATMSHSAALKALFPESAAATIADLETDFLADRESHGGRDREPIKPSTMTFYRSALGRLKGSESLGKARLDAIDKATVRAYVKERKASKVGPAGINRELQVLKTLLRFAKDEAKISDVPKIEFEKGERARDFVIGIEDFKRYLAACDPLLLDVAQLMGETAMRPGEVVRVKPEHVNLQRRTLAITDGKSSAARRVVGFSKAVAAVLRARIAEGGEYVFPVPGIAPESKVAKLSHLHDAARNAAGLSKRFVLYGLRHRLATLAAEAGVSAFQLQAMMGWSNPAMAAHYVHMAGEANVKSFQTVQKFLTESSHT